MTDTSTLKAWIKTDKLPDVLIFTGPEVEMQSIYIRQIAKTRNAEIKNIEDLHKLGAGTRSKSFINKRTVYVLRDCKEYQDDKAAAFVADAMRSSGDLLIVIYSTLDKRTKWFKTNEDRIINFEHLSTSILKKYVAKEVQMDDVRMTKLIEVCENDYSRILLEIDKIRQYMTARKCSAADALDYLLECGVIYTPPRDAVFDFVDAVFKHKPKQAFRLLEETYAGGEATLIILTNLYNAAKQLAQVQAYSGDDICGATGLTPFQVKLASGRKGVYSTKSLIQAMRIIREAEKGIKTGTIEEMYAVPYILGRMWAK